MRFSFLFLLIFILLINNSLTAQYQFGWVKSLKADSISLHQGSMGGTRLAMDNAGNVFMLEYFDGKADCDPGPGVKEFTGSGLIIAKYSSTGSLIWAENFGSGLGISEIACDKQGNLYLCGGYNADISYRGNVIPYLGYNFGATYNKGNSYVCKISNNGSFLWGKNLGGKGADIAYDLDLDDQGNMSVIGRFTGTCDFDPDTGITNLTCLGMGTYICKLNTSGNLLWAKHFKTSSHVIGERIVTDINNNVLIVGSLQDSGNFDPMGSNFTLYKGSSPETYKFYTMLDKDGHLIWAKKIAEKGVWRIDDLAADGKGNTIITGAFQGNSINIETSTGIKTFYGQYAYTHFIMKSDGKGDVIWCKSFGNFEVGYFWLWTIDAKNPNFIAVTGNFEGTLDFDPGPGIVNRTAQKRDGILLVLDTNGNNVGTYTTVGADNENFYDITTDANNHIYVAGEFEAPSDFDLTDGEKIINNYSRRDLVFLKMLYCPATNLNVTVTANKNIICAGEDVQLTAHGAQTYIWPNQETTPSIIEKPLVSTQYSVIGKDYQGCGDTGTINITVNPLPVVAFSGKTFITAPENPEIYLANQDSNWIYNWSTINGTLVSGQGTSAVTVDWDDKVYGASITLQIEDKTTNCTGKKSDTINIKPLGFYKINNTEIEVFPIPASNVLYINGFDSREKAEVTITDITGRTVYHSFDNISSAYEVNVGFLPVGIYIIRLYNSTANARVKFIKN